uniref:Uncharacterized protein n=1 Tax=Arundo donax TaxID=35708 RepID=A0A0A9C8I0_ARUDO
MLMFCTNILNLLRHTISRTSKVYNSFSCVFHASISLYCLRFLLD